MEIQEQALQHFHDGNLDEAERLLRALLKADPANARAYNHLAIVRLHQQQPQEALELFTTALSFGEQPDILGNYASVLYLLGRQDEALAVFDKIIRTAGTSAARTDALYNKASFLASDDKFEAALPCIEQALAAAPQNAEMLAAKGWILCQLNRHQDALTAFNQARAIRPLSAQEESNLAILLQSMERPGRLS